jgi:rare lipoprotein A
MRRILLLALPLGLCLSAAPDHRVAMANATSIARAEVPIEAWSARRQHRHHVRSSGTTRGFGWFFANPSRVAGSGSCVGNRIVATWYASGRRTASGAAFNPSGLTAAHRTLPFGSRVTVTNPRTSQSVTVTINDRGPFTRGVTLDLARGAAQAIGMHGTQQVCIS